MNETMQNTICHLIDNDDKSGLINYIKNIEINELMKDYYISCNYSLSQKKYDLTKILFSVSNNIKFVHSAFFNCLSKDDLDGIIWLEKNNYINYSDITYQQAMEAVLSHDSTLVWDYYLSNNQVVNTLHDANLIDVITEHGTSDHVKKLLNVVKPEYYSQFWVKSVENYSQNNRGDMIRYLFEKNSELITPVLSVEVFKNACYNQCFRIIEYIWDKVPDVKKIATELMNDKTIFWTHHTMRFFHEKNLDIIEHNMFSYILNQYVCGSKKLRRFYKEQLNYLKEFIINNPHQRVKIVALENIEKTDLKEFIEKIVLHEKLNETLSVKNVEKRISKL